MPESYTNLLFLSDTSTIPFLIVLFWYAKTKTYFSILTKTKPKYNTPPLLKLKPNYNYFFLHELKLELKLIKKLIRLPKLKLTKTTFVFPKTKM